MSITRLSVLVYTPVLFDFTTEDRYWIEIPCLLLIDKAKTRGSESSGSSTSVKSYAELACAQELSEEATGVLLNECAALWV